MGKNVSVLTAYNVERVFAECLYRISESDYNAIEVNSTYMQLTFNARRIELVRDKIGDMIMMLPEGIRTQEGLSLLEAHKAHTGQQWTDLRFNVEQLLMLGIAAGEIEACQPKDMASRLVGVLSYRLVVK